MSSGWVRGTVRDGTAGSGPGGGAGRPAWPGGALRDAVPFLAARVPVLPPEHRAVLPDLVDVRPAECGLLPRAVRLSRWRCRRPPTGGGLGSLWRFLRRRAWRILPAYYAALAFSLVVALYIVPATHKGPPTPPIDGGLRVAAPRLRQGPHPETGRFWSVAVEVELYLLFPLFLLIRRRLGALVLLAVALLPAALYALAAPHHTPPEGRHRPDPAPDPGLRRRPARGRQ